MSCDVGEVTEWLENESNIFATVFYGFSGVSHIRRGENLILVGSVGTFLGHHNFKNYKFYKHL